MIMLRLDPSRNKSLRWVIPAGLGIAFLLTFLLSGPFSRKKLLQQKSTPRIYQVGASIGQGQADTSPLPLAEVLSEEFSQEVLAATRIFPERPRIGRYEGRVFREAAIYRADARFFEVFDFPMLKGKASEALKTPFSVVMTASCARRYFAGEARPGLQLTIDHQAYVLTGIVEDPGPCESMQFDMLLSLSSITPLEKDQSWSWNIVETYVRLDEEACAQKLRERLPSVVEKYARPQLGEDFDSWLRQGGQTRCFMRSV
jgi:putative ABC transport system permease protein